MSKKSRRRNRKILGALAAGLGAMALMKGRRANQMSGMETVSDAQKEASQLGTGDTGTNKVVLDTAKIIQPKVTNKGFQTRFTARGDDGVWRGPMAHKRYMDSTAGNLVPPSMRSGAETAQGFVRRVPVGQRTRGGKGSVNYGWTTQPYKKGGRDKLAKRGLGRAFTKSKKQYKEII